MRKEQIINDNWLFRYHDGSEYNVNIPHTWNNEDGQDVGDDYYRGTCFYEKTFTVPSIMDEERLYIEFNGVNASARVVINGKEIISHDGGYSTFRADITDYVKKINPDNVTKTITNIQKIMALVAGVGAANTVNAAKSNKLTGDPLFDRRFDEWY